MKEHFITINPSIKDRFNEAKYRAGKATIKALNWVVENKELVVVAAPVVIAVASGITKVTAGCIRRHNLRAAEEIKNLYCYDRSLGHYWRLRKPLTNAQWVSINNRRKSGETLADILMSLKVLA